MNDFSKAHIALLFGGTSAEREVSLNSGAAVAKAFDELGLNYSIIDVGASVVHDLQRENFTHAFNILHGRGGEDGTIQGVLEWLQIPYTGSGVMASSLAMDKLRTKQVWLGAGLPTAPYRVLSDSTDFAEVLATMGGKVIVKPAREGSSIGITPAASTGELENGYSKAKELDDLVIAEKWLEGKEYTVCFIGDEVLQIIGFSTPGEFYDYQAKYISNDNEYFIPSGLTAEQDKKVQQISTAAFKALGCTSWGRIDVMFDENDKPWLLEANTLPGMTDHSFIPMAGKAAGMEFKDTVLAILQTATLYGGFGHD